MSNPRYAVYYTPPPESPLARFGARVIGYDCFHATATPQREVAGLDPSILALATVQPRRYGFHATLVAPFRLGGGDESGLCAALAAFATAHRPVRVGPLRVTRMGGFVVLRPAQPFPQVDEFAAVALEAFDRFRAPIAPEERARRLASGLTSRQLELMERWGYPHVLDQFRFHMTLAGPLDASMCEQFEIHLNQAFGSLASNQVELDALSLMRQDDPSASFRIVARCRLSGK